MFGWGFPFLLILNPQLPRRNRHPNTTGTSNWLLGVNAGAIDTQPITYARGEIKFNKKSVFVWFKEKVGPGLNGPFSLNQTHTSC